MLLIRRLSRAYEQVVVGTAFVPPASKLSAAKQLAWLCLHMYRCTRDPTVSREALQRASALLFSRHLPVEAAHDPSHQQAQLAVLLAGAMASTEAALTNEGLMHVCVQLLCSALLVSLHNDAVCAATACQGDADSLQDCHAASGHLSYGLLPQVNEVSRVDASTTCHTPWAAHVLGPVHCVVPPLSPAATPPANMAAPPPSALPAQPAQSTAACSDLLLSLGVVPPEPAASSAQATAAEGGAGLAGRAASVRSQGALTSMHSGVRSTTSARTAGGAGVADGEVTGPQSPWRHTAMTRSEDLYGFLINTPPPTHNLSQAQREAAEQLQAHLDWMRSNAHLVNDSDLRAVHLVSSGRLAMDGQALAALALRRKRTAAPTTKSSLHLCVSTGAATYSAYSRLQQRAGVDVSGTVQVSGRAAAWLQSTQGHTGTLQYPHSHREEQSGMFVLQSSLREAAGFAFELKQQSAQAVQTGPGVSLHLDTLLQAAAGPHCHPVKKESARLHCSVLWADGLFSSLAGTLPLVPAAAPDANWLLHMQAETTAAGVLTSPALQFVQSLQAIDQGGAPVFVPLGGAPSLRSLALALTVALRRRSRRDTGTQAAEHDTNMLELLLPVLHAALPWLLVAAPQAPAGGEAAPPPMDGGPCASLVMEPEMLQDHVAGKDVQASVPTIHWYVLCLTQECCSLAQEVDSPLAPALAVLLALQANRLHAEEGHSGMTNDSPWKSCRGLNACLCATWLSSILGLAQSRMNALPAVRPVHQPLWQQMRYASTTLLQTAIDELKEWRHLHCDNPRGVFAELAPQLLREQLAWSPAVLACEDIHAEQVIAAGGAQAVVSILSRMSSALDVQQAVVVCAEMAALVAVRDAMQLQELPAQQGIAAGEALAQDAGSAETNASAAIATAERICHLAEEELRPATLLGLKAPAPGGGLLEAKLVEAVQAAADDRRSRYHGLLLDADAALKDARTCASHRRKLVQSYKRDLLQSTGTAAGTTADTTQDGPETPHGSPSHMQWVSSGVFSAHGEAIQGKAALPPAPPQLQAPPLGGEALHKKGESKSAVYPGLSSPHTVQFPPSPLLRAQLGQPLPTAALGTEPTQVHALESKSEEPTAVRRLANGNQKLRRQRLQPPPQLSLTVQGKEATPRARRHAATRRIIRQGLAEEARAKREAAAAQALKAVSPLRRGSRRQSGGGASLASSPAVSLTSTALQQVQGVAAPGAGTSTSRSVASTAARGSQADEALTPLLQGSISQLAQGMLRLAATQGPLVSLSSLSYMPAVLGAAESSTSSRHMSPKPHAGADSVQAFDTIQGSESFVGAGLSVLRFSRAFNQNRLTQLLLMGAVDAAICEAATAVSSALQGSKRLTAAMQTEVALAAARIRQRSTARGANAWPSGHRRAAAQLQEALAQLFTPSSTRDMQERLRCMCFLGHLAPPGFFATASSEQQLELLQQAVTPLVPRRATRRSKAHQPYSARAGFIFLDRTGDCGQESKRGGLDTALPLPCAAGKMPSSLVHAAVGLTPAQLQRALDVTAAHSEAVRASSVSAGHPALDLSSSLSSLESVQASVDLRETIPWASSRDIEVEACPVRTSPAAAHDCLHLAAALVRAVRDQTSAGGDMTEADAQAAKHRCVQELHSIGWLQTADSSACITTHDAIGQLDPSTVHWPAWVAGTAQEEAIPGQLYSELQCELSQLPPAAQADAAAAMALLGTALASRSAGRQGHLGGGAVTAAAEACSLALAMTHLQPNHDSVAVERCQDLSTGHGRSMASVPAQIGTQLLAQGTDTHLGVTAAQRLLLQVSLAQIMKSVPAEDLTAACPWVRQASWAGCADVPSSGAVHSSTLVVADIARNLCAAAQAWLDAHVDRTCALRLPLWCALVACEAGGEADGKKQAALACKQLKRLHQLHILSMSQEL